MLGGVERREVSVDVGRRGEGTSVPSTHPLLLKLRLGQGREHRLGGLLEGAVGGVPQRVHGGGRDWVLEVFEEEEEGFRDAALDDGVVCARALMWLLSCVWMRVWACVEGGEGAR